jgi:hypothetical protein
MIDDLATQLTLIARHAPILREAGVQSLTVGEISMVLLPPDPPPMEEAASGEPDQPVSLMEDPESYGLPEGATLPGFIRPADL